MPNSLRPPREPTHSHRELNRPVGAQASRRGGGGAEGRWGRLRRPRPSPPNSLGHPSLVGLRLSLVSSVHAVSRTWHLHKKTSSLPSNTITRSRKWERI